MKFNKYKNQYQVNEKLDNLLNPNEKIIWRGRPKKNAFILNKILVMMPIALVWLAFDATFITLSCVFWTEMPTPLIIFLIVFFILHLMPVWLWIASIVTAARQYRFTEYAVTDKRVLIKSGFVAAGYTSIYYQEIRSVVVHIGIIDRLTKVGDVMISRGDVSNRVDGILDIENPYEVYKILEKTTRDIATDISYPNAFRPDENKGYDTHYDNKQ